MFSVGQSDAVFLPPPCGAPWVSKIGPWGSKIGPWGSKSVPGSWGVPGSPRGPWRFPGGSWEAPGGLPEDFRDSGRPPERSKGVPEEHFEQFWIDFVVIFGSKIVKNRMWFLDLFFMIFESKKHGLQTLGILDLKRPYGEFEGFLIFQKIASEINFGLFFY